jgi:hypothetical protein
VLNFKTQEGGGGGRNRENNVIKITTTTTAIGFLSGCGSPTLVQTINKNNTKQQK